jgi:uncharacterized membrane protein YcaP (DUF421 family)
METVLRGLTLYFVLMLLLRFTGKRALQQITTFDFVLLLIIAEATQQGLSGDDYSVTTALILVTTLVAVDTLLSKLKDWFPRLDRVMDSLPLVIVEDGKPLKERMEKERIAEDDILEAARELQGLERMDQIKYAVLERSGGISIIPKRTAKSS